VPKGSKLDKCHNAVEKSLIKKGLSKKEATGKAWGYCKKNVLEDSNIDRVIKEAEKELKELEYE